MVARRVVPVNRLPISSAISEICTVISETTWIVGNNEGVRSEFVLFL